MGLGAEAESKREWLPPTSNENHENHGNPVAEEKDHGKTHEKIETNVCLIVFLSDLGLRISTSAHGRRKEMRKRKQMIDARLVLANGPADWIAEQQKSK